MRNIEGNLQVPRNSVTLVHVFIDHSNVWGGARGASRLKDPKMPDLSARISIKHLDRVLVGSRIGLSTKIVSGGIPPGMEGVWAEYQSLGYDTQRLVRDDAWRERGVDHTIIGHMWRLLALHQSAPTLLILASGDGKTNEFGTSFFEIVREVLTRSQYESWRVQLASFDWAYPNSQNLRSPTSSKMKKLVNSSERGVFLNLDDHYEKVVYHKDWATLKPVERSGRA
jgi:hypothetical protein